MNGTLPEFEDPQLKAIVRRATLGGGGGATSELRDRVAGLVARETQAAPLRPVRPWRARLAWVAMAAAILAVASVGAVYLWQRHHEAAEREEYLAANLPLFTDMIREHGRSDAAGFDALAMPLDDRDGVRKSLAAKMGRSVPVPDWREKGWRLTRAGVGAVGKHAAAELRYENAGRAILLVSLPADAYSGHEGEEPEPYEYTVDGHPIAGFVKDGGLHCAIGGKGVTPRELADLKID